MIQSDHDYVPAFVNLDLSFNSRGVPDEKFIEFYQQERSMR